MGNLKILSNILFVNLLNPKHQCFQGWVHPVERCEWTGDQGGCCDHLWIPWGVAGGYGWGQRWGGGYAFKLMMSPQFHHWWRRSSEEQPDQVLHRRSWPWIARIPWQPVSSLSLHPLLVVVRTTITSSSTWGLELLFPRIKAAFLNTETTNLTMISCMIAIVL